MSHPAEGRRLSWPEHTVGYQLVLGCLQMTQVSSKGDLKVTYKSDTLPLDHLQLHSVDFLVVHFISTFIACYQTRQIFVM